MKIIIWIIGFATFFLAMSVTARLNMIEDMPNPNTQKVFPPNTPSEDMEPVILLENSEEEDKKMPRIDIEQSDSNGVNSRLEPQNKKNNLDIEVMKSKSISSIEKIILTLKKYKDKLNTLPIATEVTMTVINVIDETINYLKKTIIDIEAVESLEDLKIVLDEAKITLKENKEIIKLLVKEMEGKLTNLSVDEINKTIEELEKALKLLKIVCPSQIKNIEILEDNLDDIVTLMININEYIATQNYQAAKNTIIEAKNMILELNEAVQGIYKACGL